MTGAPSAQKGPRGYEKQGGYHRQKLLDERGSYGIDVRSRSGRDAKAWSGYALCKKGGEMCSIDVRLKIETASFYLWRALEFHCYLVSDARKRGAVINRRSGTRTCAILSSFSTTRHRGLAKHWRFSGAGSTAKHTSRREIASRVRC